MMKNIRGYAGKRIFWGIGIGILIANLLGCGNNQAAASGVQGVFIDSNTISFMQTQFDETKTCTGLSKGSFSDLSIIMMPPSFPCPYYTTGCSGEFDTPNFIKVGMFNSWRHEVVHYLLYVNTGDPDSQHTSPFFKTCTT
ncbi:MAG: hypothetical protein ACYDBV_08955 [Nitrospiria bacterium]